MRCPHCQATNPDTATFCGQCYQRFTASERPSDLGLATDADRGADPVATPTRSGGPADARPDPDRPSATAPVAVGRFVVTDGGLTWRCAVCETTNAVGVNACTVCGTKMDAEAPRGGATPVAMDQARRLESFIPGLGHLRTGQTGMGAARISIVVVWLLGALVLVTGGPAGLLTAAPMVVGIAVIWVTGPGDLAAATAGRQPRLDARRFMYLVIGVTTGVILAGGLAVIL